MLAAATPAQAVTNLHDLESVLNRGARHKQVIGAIKIDHGSHLRHALNGMNAFAYAYGEGEGALHVACVFYGTSLFFAANDWLWSTYRLFDVLDQTGDALPELLHTPQNPFYHLQPGAGRDDASMQTLMKRGMSVLVCNNALTAISRDIARSQQKDERRVYDDFSKNLVSGALIVPAGVAAIVLAQEAGYRYLT